MTENERKTWLYYQWLVRKITAKNVKNNYIEGQDLKEKGYDVHLDHRLSILEGYKQGYPAELVADPQNLQYIPKDENLKKSSKSSTTLADLFFEMSESDYLMS
jgi:hypothetical protein